MKFERSCLIPQYDVLFQYNSEKKAAFHFDIKIYETSHVLS